MAKQISDTRLGRSNTISRIGELGKVPPQAQELEQAVLGALMLERDALTDVIDALRPESFYNEKHKVIYQAILDLFRESAPVDLLTVTNKLRTNGDLEMAGGAFYVTELTSKVNSASNVEYHARIVSEMAIKRELIKISGEIQHEAYEDTSDVFELLDKTQSSIFEVSENNVRKNYENMKEIMVRAIKELEIRKDQEDGLTGVPSGLAELDKITNGWQPSDLIIIAARPAMGKTAFILSCVRNAAVDHGKACAVFSLEMSNVQLVNRLICAEAEIESDKIRKGNLSDHEWVQLHTRIKKLTEAPIFIDDTPGLSILDLRAKCRRLKTQHDIQLVVIDYLQLMSGGGGNKGGGNREQEIASISRSLKGLAKELSVPVIALAQLSRAVETRNDKKPQLSDLRESGSIEQDADQVMFLYRPEYYNITEDADGNPTNGLGYVIIGKNRHGSLEDVALRFIGKYTKFTSLDLQTMGASSGFSPSDTSHFDKVGPGQTFQSKMNSGEDFSFPTLSDDADF
jgi:replicative DNA helicase